jgi:hypothetical protein
MTTQEVVERQLERYNDHDLDGFCSCYSDDIELINLPASEPYLRSRDSLRELYGQKFANPALKARIVNRMVKGSFVIDHEKVGGLGEGEKDVIAIYEVRDELIRRVSFIR